MIDGPQCKVKEICCCFKISKQKMLCWFQKLWWIFLDFKMRKYFSNSVKNTSYRNTFCNVAVDYELVAFWRYFIIRLFLFHHQIVFISSSDLFVFHLQIFFISASDFSYFITIHKIFLYFIIRSVWSSINVDQIENPLYLKQFSRCFWF